MKRARSALECATQVALSNRGEAALECVGPATLSHCNRARILKRDLRRALQSGFTAGRTR